MEIESRPKEAIFIEGSSYYTKWLYKSSSKASILRNKWIKV
jgi:hypothetical protein